MKRLLIYTGMALSSLVLAVGGAHAQRNHSASAAGGTVPQPKAKPTSGSFRESNGGFHGSHSPTPVKPTVVKRKPTSIDKKKASVRKTGKSNGKSSPRGQTRRGLSGAPRLDRTVAAGIKDLLGKIGDAVVLVALEDLLNGAALSNDQLVSINQFCTDPDCGLTPAEVRCISTAVACCCDGGEDGDDDTSSGDGDE